MKAEFAKSVAEVGETFKMAEQTKAAFEQGEATVLAGRCFEAFGRD